MPHRARALSPGNVPNTETGVRADRAAVIRNVVPADPVVVIPPVVLVGLAAVIRLAAPAGLAVVISSAVRADRAAATRPVVPVGLAAPEAASAVHVVVPARAAPDAADRVVPAKSCW